MSTYRYNYLVIFLAVGLSLVSFCCTTTAETVNWLTSYDKALKLAKEKNKPIMVDFYAKWCGWCKRLDKDTYRDEKVIEVSRDFICLKIDGDKNRLLARKYEIRGYPTILFLDGDGKKIGGGPGYRDAGQLLSEMRQILKKY